MFDMSETEQKAFITGTEYAIGRVLYWLDGAIHNRLQDVKTSNSTGAVWQLYAYQRLRENVNEMVFDSVFENDPEPTSRSEG